MNTDILEQVFSSREEAIVFAGSDVIKIPEMAEELENISVNSKSISPTMLIPFRIARLKEFRLGGNVLASHWRYCLEPE